MNFNIQPNERGYWGEFGGRFVPETLMSPLEELTESYFIARDDADFQAEFRRLLKDFSGRPTPLFHAKRFFVAGPRVFQRRLRFRPGRGPEKPGKIPRPGAVAARTRRPL